MKKLLEKPMSSSDILKYTGGKTNIYVYSQLYNYNNIDELFDGKNSITILYEILPEVGHWCCINKITDDLIEFFDPYGLFIDQQLRFVKDKAKRTYQMRYPMITRLFDDSRYKLSYNEYAFQKKDTDIGTCGRHCMIRIKYNHIPLEQYKKIFEKLSYLGDPDDIAVFMTFEL